MLVSYIPLFFKREVTARAKSVWIFSSGYTITFRIFEYLRLTNFLCSSDSYMCFSFCFDSFVRGIFYF